MMSFDERADILSNVIVAVKSKTVQILVAATGRTSG